MRYAVTPWHLTIELVHRPEHLPDGKNPDARLYGPAQRLGSKQTGWVRFLGRHWWY